MISTRWHCRIAIGLDALIGLNFFVIAVITLNAYTIYYEGYNPLEYAFEILGYLILIRIGTLIPWRRLRHLSPMNGVVLLLSGAALVTFLWVLINVNFYKAVQAIIITRISFDDASDEEIARDIAEYNLWYPQTSLVAELKETVPEGDGIAYIGDQRGHIMSALLYPRRVYALPELQLLLNKAIGKSWTWHETEDPLRPSNDPLNPRLNYVAEPLADPDVQENLQQMIEERDIQWVLYYDAARPDRSWLRRIGG